MACRRPWRPRHAAGFLTALAATVAAAPAAAQVSGIAFDSVEVGPLPGAIIQLARRGGPVVTVQADDRGRWRADSLAPGAWAVMLSHPRLDEYGVEVRGREVQVPADTGRPMTLAIPSAATLVRQLCGAAAGDSLGALVVRVRSATTGEPVPMATVRADFVTLAVRQRAVAQERGIVTASADPEGQAVLCGIPAGEGLQLRAARVNDASGTLALTMPLRRVMWQELYLGPANEAATGRLSGWVRDLEGAPVRGARIQPRGLSRVLVSDEDGALAAADLPLGTWQLEAHALGHIPQQLVVHVREGVPADARIALPRAGQALAPVVVSARANALDARRASFETHRKAGMGRFFDEQRIAEHNTGVVTDLLRTVPGVVVDQGDYTSGGSQVSMRMFNGGAGADGIKETCAPSLFLDGVRLGSGITIDRLVAESDLIGIEVYTRVSGIPIEFQGFSNCGVIALWTGKQTRRVPR